MNQSPAKDSLITEADVRAFKDEVNRGRLKQRVYELIEQEPELAFYVSEHYAKTFENLEEAGIDDQRLADLHKRISLLVWGATILVSRAQRRQWDGFLPSEETNKEGGGQ